MGICNPLPDCFFNSYISSRTKILFPVVGGVYEAGVSGPVSCFITSPHHWEEYFCPAGNVAVKKAIGERITYTHSIIILKISITNIAKTTAKATTITIKAAINDPTTSIPPTEKSGFSVGGIEVVGSLIAALMIQLPLFHQLKNPDFSVGGIEVV